MTFRPEVLPVVPELTVVFISYPKLLGCCAVVIQHSQEQTDALFETGIYIPY